MRTVALIFPHQLFSAHPVLRDDVGKVCLIEDTLFFGDRHHPLTFHRQKLAFHCATLDAYEQRLAKRYAVERVPYEQKASGLASLIKRLAGEEFDCIRVADVHDFLLHKRLVSACEKAGITLQWVATPGFINTPEENREYRSTRKRWFMADFYQWQRRRLDLLMDGDQPDGGQWSYDEDNRKKMPAKEIPLISPLPTVRRSPAIKAACQTSLERFPKAWGSVDQWVYPTTHKSANDWLATFFEQRFVKFGPYEDAMLRGENFLHHGVLTPMLNVGLLTPRQVIDAAIEAQHEFDVPINSMEGFVRQIIGWREFMRATYDDLGVAMRTTNHWQHTNPLPPGFYTAETGIDPIDDCIGRILDTGYCHHIERLMLLGGFLFLCEVDPDEVYRWFMEMFVDAYDWVMVPNVYAMSQHADGGAITTKPYFSGSNYVLKMSNHKRGDWCSTWDGLYWRWIWTQRKTLGNNPRWAMMCRTVEKMDTAKRRAHLDNAERYLSRLQS